MSGRLSHLYRVIRCHGLARGFREIARDWTERGHNHVRVLSRRPAILYLWWGRDDSVLHTKLKDRELILLYLFPWSFPGEEVLAISRRVKDTLSRHPRHRILFLCNEEYSVGLLEAQGLTAKYVHQNAFIDEGTFMPKPDVRRTHDAIYNASMAPYKRHLLAEKVNSLIMLTYAYSGTTVDGYADEVRKRLAHAWWPKDSLMVGEKMPVGQMADIYSRAHVGLCLSAIEGGMFASMECLLSGLPIVSTESVGGRDAFWDDRYVTVCNDDADSVAQAVDELKARNIPADCIRRWTLEKITPHRERLRELMQSLGAREFVCPWPPGTHGITSWTNLSRLAATL